ncbi:hypothetical protein BU24DRAFT_488198 [Aaosphaeria arxii CBS 175.79]|uniref:ABM domain-containing protein n=1 Tax=Aaosphaeria arxii CBS 175.79 TaxID=1450172 RepID=A0A6A5YB89_9PLEO|nr:uncharacterized protein BU24DRAFT_488198 [Aaosphaeria arxii CBS 175.79]KAF2021864.1 hypothetical protein BU24DRAFT_488198 [Aaosphaeria arxii CBS 175.79]
MADDFYIFANCNFVPDRYDDWQAAYDKLAEYVWASEPATKTYYFGIPLDYAHDISKTTSMLAFEVYASRDDLYGPNGHLSSPAMATFLAAIPAVSTTGLDISHYALVSGFHDASQLARPAGIMQDVRVTCVSASARDTLLSSLATLVSWAEGTQGTLSYMAFKSLDDEVGVRIFGRWRERRDMEAFMRSGEVVGFWMEGKEGIKGMEQRGYVENGKGWLHRGVGSGFAGERKGEERRVEARI